MIKFTVPHPPKPQPRPQAKIVKQRKSDQSCHGCGQPIGGYRIFAQVRTEDSDHPVKLWKLQILDAWRAVMPSPGFRFQGPLRVVLNFVMPRPSNQCWKTKPMPSVPDTRQNGDFDNLAKAACDALNGKAWVDDRQIADCTVYRWIAGGIVTDGQIQVEPAHLEITILKLDPATERATRLDLLDLEHAKPF